MEAKISKHGGARGGAGRKRRERLRVKMSFTLRPETARAIEERIGLGERSDFVDSIIAERLGVTREWGGS